LSSRSNDAPKAELETLGLVLTDFLSGTLTVCINNFPFLKVNGESKTLDVELKGFKESGLHLGDMLEKGDKKKDLMDTIKESSSVARRLHEIGWEIRVFEGEDSLIAMGNGVSSLTGYVWFNTLKLWKIRDII
jgi:hypothetical protein